MNEKIILKSKQKNIKPLCLSLPIIGIFISLCYFCSSYSNEVSYYEYKGWDYSAGKIISGIIRSDGGLPFVALLIPFLGVIGYIIYKNWSKVEMVVTDKRVYGIAASGRRVDLPLDSISAVGTSAFSGIAITTASGAIKFVMLANRDELHDAVSKLLVNRQNKGETVATTTGKQEISPSNADELKKYKDLLDSGVITQEEFDAKKKQLLGL